jgi:hypothetical protein
VKTVLATPTEMPRHRPGRATTVRIVGLPPGPAAKTIAGPTKIAVKTAGVRLLAGHSKIAEDRGALGCAAPAATAESVGPLHLRRHIDTGRIVTMPAVTMPVVTMPVVTMPVVTMPVVTMPVVTMPVVTMRIVAMPVVTMRIVAMRIVAMRIVAMPVVTMPAVTMPAVTMPVVAMRIVRAIASRLPIGVQHVAARHTGIQNTVRTIRCTTHTIRCTTRDDRQPTLRPMKSIEIDTEGIGMSRSGSTPIEIVVRRPPGTNVAARRPVTIAVAGTRVLTETVTSRLQVVRALDLPAVDGRRAMTGMKIAGLRVDGTVVLLRHLRMLTRGEEAIAMILRPHRAASRTTINRSSTF